MKSFVAVVAGLVISGLMPGHAPTARADDPPAEEPAPAHDERALLIGALLGQQLVLRDDPVLALVQPRVTQLPIF